MKIAQLLYSGLGGHGSVAWGIYDALKKNGDQTIMGFYGIETMAPTYMDRCKTESVGYQYIASKPKRSFLAFPKIFSWLRKEKPNVLILHSVRAIIPCVLAKWRYKTKIIFVEHQANDYKSKQDWLASRLGMRYADQVVYLTESYQQEMRLRLGKLYKDSKVSVIPNGVDCQYYQPNPHKPNLSKEVTFGMAARFTNLRHQAFLVDLLAYLQQYYPSITWRLLLAGDGPTYRQVTDKVMAMDLQNAVELSGYLNESSLVSWFHRLDLYVHATAGETLSTSMLQAMACGLPIVASDVKGVTNLMQVKPTFGKCVASCALASFADAIYTMISDEGAFRQYANNAREVVTRYYSLDAMGSAYISLMRKA